MPYQSLRGQGTGRVHRTLHYHGGQREYPVRSGEPGQRLPGLGVRHRVDVPRHCQAGHHRAGWLSAQVIEATARTGTTNANVGSTTIGGRPRSWVTSSEAAASPTSMAQTADPRPRRRPPRSRRPSWPPSRTGPTTGGPSGRGPPAWAVSELVDVLVEPGGHPETWDFDSPSMPRVGSGGGSRCVARAGRPRAGPIRLRRPGRRRRTGGCCSGSAAGCASVRRGLGEQVAQHVGGVDNVCHRLPTRPPGLHHYEGLNCRPTRLRRHTPSATATVRCKRPSSHDGRRARVLHRCRSRARSDGGGWGIRTPEGLHPTRFPIALTGVRGSRPTSICAGQRRSADKDRRSPTSPNKKELLPKLLPAPAHRSAKSRAPPRRRGCIFLEITLNSLE